MAKDKTRERKLPGWVEQRTSWTIHLSDATAAYYGIGGKVATWFDRYGAFRQGAKVRQ